MPAFTSPYTLYDEDDRHPSARMMSITRPTPPALSTCLACPSRSRQSWIRRRDGNCFNLKGREAWHTKCLWMAAQGTTGLKIFDRLPKRADVELLAIAAGAGRKDLHARASLINQSDVTFLCLPDEAAREIVPLVREQVRLLDTSTGAPRAPGLDVRPAGGCGRSDKIRSANRVAVPGCHATGFNVIAAAACAAGDRSGGLSPSVRTPLPATAAAAKR